jgi:hypothetical protein
MAYRESLEIETEVISPGWTISLRHRKLTSVSHYYATKIAERTDNSTSLVSILNTVNRFSCFGIEVDGVVLLPFVPLAPDIPVTDTAPFLTTVDVVVVTRFGVTCPRPTATSCFPFGLMARSRIRQGELRTALVTLP